MIRVFIVEDEPDLRAELSAQLGGQADLSVRGVFADAESAEAALEQASPEVVLTDVRLPGRSGIDLIRDWAPRLPETAFLVLSTFDDDDQVFAALEAGATGYLLKRSLPSEVAEAIRQLQAGGSPMSSSIARKVVRAFQGPSGDVRDRLSDREKDLLDLLTRGRSYKECAEAMKISIHTVRTHIQRIYKKLQVHTRHEAIAKAGVFSPRLRR